MSLFLSMVTIPSLLDSISFYLKCVFHYPFSEGMRLCKLFQNLFQSVFIFPSFFTDSFSWYLIIDWLLFSPVLWRFDPFVLDFISCWWEMCYQLVLYRYSTFFFLAVDKIFLLVLVFRSFITVWLSVFYFYLFHIGHCMLPHSEGQVFKNLWFSTLLSNIDFHLLSSGQKVSKLWPGAKSCHCLFL